MTAQYLNGRELAKRINGEIRDNVEQLAAADVYPHLVAITLGEPAASKVYTRFQRKACEAVGIDYELKVLPPDITEADLLGVIEKCNQTDDITGIIVQLPLPGHINARTVHDAVSPSKDVEGMHSINYGRMFSNTGHVAPCTAMAAVELLKSSQQPLAGLEAVIVGHSEIVGKPIAMLLLQSPTESPTVTVCHVATRDLAAHVKRADILIVAVGCSQRRWEKHWYASSRASADPLPQPDLKPLISADMLKPGCIVIDVAINRIPVGFDESGQPLRDDDGKIRMQTVGDVDFAAACETAAYITPVPGGVGPVTVQMLLRNTLACARIQKGL